jgi:hypothetical protein
LHAGQATGRIVVVGRCVIQLIFGGFYPAIEIVGMADCSGIRRAVGIRDALQLTSEIVLVEARTAQLVDFARLVVAKIIGVLLGSVVGIGDFHQPIQCIVLILGRVVSCVGSRDIVAAQVVGRP